VVVTVSVEVTPGVIEDGERLHVAGSLVAVGVMAQVRVTVLLNPPDGVTLIVDVLPLVAPGATLMSPLLERAKVAGAAEVTVTLTAAVCVMPPDVAVTVIT
jgi:hypothetical protein